jgi:uncharacterized membrane protein YfcA
MRAEHFALLAIMCGLGFSVYYENQRDKKVRKELHKLFIAVILCGGGVGALFLTVLLKG